MGAVPRAHLPVAAVFVTTGSLHLAVPRPYERIMPARLPAHRALVYLSGIAEIAGGVAALHPRTRVAAGRWLAATLVAVFPANVTMAVNAQRFAPLPPALLWLRLPLQAPLVFWVLRATSPRRPRRRGRRR
jgi:uncharacterized membrane protein